MTIYKKAISFSIIVSLFAALMTKYIFIGGFLFLVFPVFLGLLLVFIQHHNRTYKYLGALFLGSMLFGFLVILLDYFLDDLLVYFFTDLYAGYSFWQYFSKSDIIVAPLVFAFVSFLSGLVGIVIKGFVSKITDIGK